MSVIAHSPVSKSAKRLYTEDFQLEPFDRHHSAVKRARFHSSPASGRCSVCPAELPVIVSHTALAGLLALFPDMDEKIVSDVLANCGSNIDAAIRHLNELRLVDGHQNRNGHSNVAPVEQASTEQQRATEAGPKTGEQWVDYLVQEMAAAKDVDDARKRAGVVLQRFESSCKQGPEAAASMQDKLLEVQKENGILKRAVQIQNQRIQERSQQEREIQQLKHMLAQYQEQVRTLELSNYSLTLHLQKATHANTLAGQRPPDVF